MIDTRAVDLSARDGLGPAMSAAGMTPVRLKSAAWRSDDRHIFAWLVHDSKARDPLRGGALTLEFEHSPDGSWTKKVSGRVRIGALLRPEEFEPFLAMQNRVISSLRRPTDEELSRVPESLRSLYMASFDQLENVHQPHFWIRYAQPAQLSEWWTLVAPLVPTLLARTRTLDSHRLYLGRDLVWEQ